MSDSLSSLLKHGDWLERHVFLDREFATSFRVYPEIWAKYIYPNREKNSMSFANKKWSEFASRHYSAMIRCWNAKEAKLNICRYCEEFIEDQDPLLLLKIHGELFSFFCLCGSAIDNLRAAFICEPINAPSELKVNSEKDLTVRDLDWFYARRTQLVHYSVVPVFEKDGLPHFDTSWLSQERTTWQPGESSRFKSIENELDSIWQDFGRHMLAAWCRLLDKINSIEMVDQGSLAKGGSFAPLMPERIGVIPPSDSVSGVQIPNRPAEYTDADNKRRNSR